MSTGRLLDSHLPGGVAARGDLLLDVRAGGFVVPAVIFVEPVLDANLVGLDPFVGELRLDDRPRLLRLRAGTGVDEDGVVIAIDGEPLLLELLSELAGVRVRQPQSESGATGHVINGQRYPDGKEVYAVDVPGGSWRYDAGDLEDVEERLGLAIYLEVEGMLLLVPRRQILRVARDFDHGVFLSPLR